ncbi:peptidoglycan-binding domain-containing protein [Streptomyces sp. NPDC050549]|uniref:peptidoglycan-binding domain-containing protein n=1 Tax=Streptomyces sp. NPDC050549 TaxID=3155406 RepID=UPI00342C7033
MDTSHNTQSNATRLWQKVLWADGELAASDIDGDFGPITKAATARWQTRFRVTSDGSAGQNTWTAAGNWLRNSSNGFDGTVARYIGTEFIIDVTRDSNGYYHFLDGTGAGRIAGYNYRTCWAAAARPGSAVRGLFGALRGGSGSTYVRLGSRSPAAGP